MKDKRTEEEKSLSPYFSHYEYERDDDAWGKLNFIQRFLAGHKSNERLVEDGLMTRKAFFMDELTYAMKNRHPEQEDIWDGENEIAVEVTTAGGARKAVTKHQWMLEWAEGRGRDNLARLVKKSAWASRCVEIKSKAIAAIEWEIQENKKAVDNDHEAVRILREVNPDINWHELIGSTQSDLDIYGTAYWKKVRDGEGKIVHLKRLNPSTVSIKADNRGIQGFEQQLSGSAPNKFDRKDIVYFHNHDSESDVDGVASMDSCKTAMQVEIEADSHLKEFFENRASPDLIFSLPTNNPREIKRVSSTWQKDYGGRGKQHKTGWVGGKAEPHEVGYAPKDLALSDVREETRRKICAAGGVPPALVGAWEAANYATIREQRQGLYTETIIPTADYIAGVINAEYLNEFDAPLKFVWRYDQLSALQEDVNSKAKRIIWAVEAGILKREVAAELMGYGKEDVPEVPPAPKETDNDNFSPGAGPSADLREGKKGLMDKTENALRKWRRKALNRLKNDQEAVCDFESVYIDDVMEESIKGQLREAATKDEVHSIFEGAIVWRDYP